MADKNYLVRRIEVLEEYADSLQNILSAFRAEKENEGGKIKEENRTNWNQLLERVEQIQTDAKALIGAMERDCVSQL